MTSILLIEDGKTDATRMIEIINEFDPGVIVDLAETYEKAVEIYDLEKHSLILLDLNLPDLHPPETVAAVKSWAKCCIIVVSGFLSPDTIRQSMMLGAYWCIDKSADWTGLGSSVICAIAGANMHRAKRMALEQTLNNIGTREFSAEEIETINQMRQEGQ